MDLASLIPSQKLMAVVELFKKYGGLYDLDLDALLLAAQRYQESRQDQRVKSPETIPSFAFHD